MNPSDVPEYVMNTLCRICAEKSSKLTRIFNNEELPQKIHTCLSIKVNESDYLPLNVCESCFNKINDSYLLHQTAHQADGKLKELWRILVKETMGYCSDLKLQVNELESEENGDQGLIINIPGEVVERQEAESGSNEVILIGKAVTFEIVTQTTNQNFENRESEEDRKLEIQEVVETKENKNSKISSRIYQCQFCSCQLTTLASLSIHESTHSVEKPYLCDTCGKSFKHANNLRCHSRTHLSVRKKYNCKICNKGFLTNFFLQEHMNSHTGETPYKCGVCGKEFREKVHLRQHKWTHSNEKFSCHICGNTFSRKGNRNEHIKKFHKNNLKSSSSVRKKVEKRSTEKTLKCSVCDLLFSNQILLKAHLKSHPEQKRFFCAICGKKFRHSGSLTYHRRAVHTGEKPFQCSFCEEKFSLRSVQKIHERKKHTFEQPYKCTLCLQKFTNSSSLKNHLYVHSKDKMFECDECGKKFTRSSNLFVHKKLHSGDRQFTCDQCGKSYIQKHDMIKHQKVHDPKSKPFFCKYCGNSFSHKKDSSKHAMCQFEFYKKNNSDFNSAEKMLESVENSLEKSGAEFFIEEEQLILETVDELSSEVQPKGEEGDGRKVDGHSDCLSASSR